MVLPSPTEVAELMGLSPVPGPPVLKKPTPEEIERVRNVHSQLCHETSDTFSRFASQLCAGYLPSLIRTLLVMPMSLKGPSGTWWELHLDLLDVASHARTSGYFQRFVRENETDALELYVLVLESMGGFGSLRPVVLETRMLTVRALLHLWEKLLLSIPQQHLSLDELPRLSRQTLDGLTKLLLVLPVDARAETWLLADERDTLDTMVSSLLRYPEHFYEACRESTREFPGPWWRCEAGWDANGSDLGLKCVECPEGDEMMACSRCLTVRYCSKEHQKKDWKEHKKICFETEW